MEIPFTCLPVLLLDIIPTDSAALTRLDSQPGMYYSTKRKSKDTADKYSLRRSPVRWLARPLYRLRFLSLAVLAIGVSDTNTF